MMAPECLRDFFESVFMDNTEAEALTLWAHLCDTGGTYPAEALRCLDETLAAPPDDLVEVMQECGWIILVHTDPDGTVTPYSYDEHLHWLAAIVERLRERLNATGSGN